jgi:hypothetical protein
VDQFIDEMLLNKTPKEICEQVRAVAVSLEMLEQIAHVCRLNQNHEHMVCAFGEKIDKF